MDAAKIMWVMYEHPETHFEDLALRFMDIRKRIYKFPKMGVKPAWSRSRPLRGPALKSRHLPSSPTTRPG